MSGIVLVLAFVACPGEPLDSAVESDCSDPGDIDLIRFEMVSETCMWLISDCEVKDELQWDDCFSDLLYATEAHVADQGDCVDWCAAKSYTEVARQQSCAPLGDLSAAEEYALATDLIAEHFYTCDSPNYEPSGP